MILNWVETRIGDLHRILGVLLASQGVLVLLLSNFGLSDKAISAALAVAGVLLSITGKATDSASFTTLQAAAMGAAGSGTTAFSTFSTIPPSLSAAAPVVTSAPSSSPVVDEGGENIHAPSPPV